VEVRLWHEFVRYVSLAFSLLSEFANRRMAPQKSSVSKKKFSASTSVGCG
jgi:SRSO17 transposase